MGVGLGGSRGCCQRMQRVAGPIMLYLRLWLRLVQGCVGPASGLLSLLHGGQRSLPLLWPLVQEIAMLVHCWGRLAEVGTSRLRRVGGGVTAVKANRGQQE